MFVLFSSVVKIIWQMMLYCYPKEVDVLCLSSLFYIDTIFKFHLWQYGVFLNATAITTWIDLCELGCIPGATCHGLLPLPFEKDLEHGE
jgi:hypothetical protein